MRKFKKIYIEITNVCNLSCKFCPKTNRPSSFMTLEIFDKILTQIKPYGEYIYFHIKGEPLLHPEIDKFLDLSFEKGFKVNITTNGTLINKVKDKLISKPALRQVNFSLHSFDGNDNSMNKEEYINNIINFSKEAKQNNIISAFRLWNLDQDDEKNLEIVRNRHILEILEKEFELDYKIQDKINPIRGIRIDDSIYLNQDHEFSWPSLQEKEDDGIGFCYALRSQVGILVDGTVIPCCLDGEGIINLGNINTEAFGDIVENERANNLFDGFSNRCAVEELCRRCGYRKRFGK